MKLLLVEDLMTVPAVSVRETDDLTTVYDLMEDYNIRHVPVIDDDGEVVGLISHRDLIASTLEAEENMLPSLRGFLRGKKVREVMVRGVETVEPEETIEEAGRIMLENKFGCLPVADGINLLGIITESDFVRYLVEMQSEVLTRPTNERVVSHVF